MKHLNDFNHLFDILPKKNFFLIIFKIKKILEGKKKHGKWNNKNNNNGRRY